MRILEAALYAENLEETAEFYERILELERIVTVPGRHVFFRAGEAVFLLFRPSATRKPPSPEARVQVPPHGVEGEGHICFSGCAEEIERWRETLAREGIEIEADFTWPQGGRSIYFRDPAGNSIEIAEPRIWNFAQ